MVTKTVALLRLLETAWANNNKIHWYDFVSVTQDFGAHDKLSILREILILCQRRGIKFVDDFDLFGNVDRLDNLFDCAKTLSETARSHGDKISWSELEDITQRFGLDDAETLDAMLNFCQRTGIKLTNEQLAPVEKNVEPAREIDDNDALVDRILKFWERKGTLSAARRNRIVAQLHEWRERNGGKFTLDDLERIIKFGVDIPVVEIETSTVVETETLTVDEIETSTTDEIEPSTVDETEPSTTDETEPLSVDEIEPSTTDETELSPAKRRNKIVAALLERRRQNDGKLTLGDLDKILESHGIDNDADEIDEILSLCQQEGIEFVEDDDDETDYTDDDTGETGEDAIVAEAAQLEGVDLGTGEHSETAAKDDVEVATKSETIDMSGLSDSVSIDDPVRMYLKEIGRVSLLTADEEIAIAKQMESSDETIRSDAQKQLAEANLRLVVSIAKRYVGRACCFLT